MARERYPDSEIIVVDDGSTDATAETARTAGATVISHPESLGNGAAVKNGARAATGEIIAFLDGDGQHDPRMLEPLLQKIDEGYDMAVGARDSGSHANIGRLFANGLYNGIASMMSGRQILDLTSGFRVARAKMFKQFLYLLPNGFSYPTTITMAFLRSGYPVTFVPIIAQRFRVSICARHQSYSSPQRCAIMYAIKTTHRTTSFTTNCLRASTDISAIQRLLVTTWVKLSNFEYRPSLL